MLDPAFLWGKLVEFQMHQIQHERFGHKSLPNSHKIGLQGFAQSQDATEESASIEAKNTQNQLNI